jgi:hypothetical protein
VNSRNHRTYTTMNGTPPRGKPLPSRPSQDIGYGSGGGGPSNGNRKEGSSQQTYAPSPRMNERMGGPMEPSGRTVLEGYRQDIANGFEAERPRYNPVSDLRAWFMKMGSNISADARCS